MDQPAALGLVTLIVAVIGALTGLAALTWQIAQHTLTGARVRVVLKSAMIGPQGAVEAPGEIAWTQSTRTMGEFKTSAYAVHVVNRGRFPTTVESITFRVGGGMGYRPVEDLIGSGLPFRIQGGGSKSWYVDARAIWATEHASATVLNTPRRGVKADVVLADGRVKSSGRLPVLSFTE